MMRFFFLLIFQAGFLAAWGQIEVTSQAPEDPTRMDEFTYFLDDDLTVRVHQFAVNVYQGAGSYPLERLLVVNDSTLHIYKDAETVWYEIVVDAMGELSQINNPSVKPKVIKENGLALVEGAIRTEKCWHAQDWIIQFFEGADEYKLRIRDGAIAVKKNDQYLQAFRVKESNGWIVVEDPISESELLRISDPEQSLPGAAKENDGFNLWLRFPDGLVYTHIKGKDRVYADGKRLKKESLVTNNAGVEISTENGVYAVVFNRNTGKLTFAYPGE